MYIFNEQNIKTLINNIDNILSSTQELSPKQMFRLRRLRARALYMKSERLLEDAMKYRPLDIYTKLCNIKVTKSNARRFGDRPTLKLKAWR